MVVVNGPASSSAAPSSSSATEEQHVATVPIGNGDRDATLATVHTLSESAGSAFYVIDLGDVARKHTLWVESLPRVTPHYAVKCNPDPMILATLNALGAGFDCASMAEIAAVLRLGVNPARIIFANPCKSVPHLKYARANGVRKMTFDNADELRKIAQHHPQAEVVLRVLADDSKSSCRLGLKFGASRDTVRPLMETAAALGLNVAGVSFHVGSGCVDATAFADAVARARYAFDVAESVGLHPTLLDVGGGFPGVCGTGAFDLEGAGASGSQIGFDDIVAELRPAIDRYFPVGCGVDIIGEPGRYYVTSAICMAVQVIAKRRIEHAAGPQAERARERDAAARADDNLPPSMTAHVDNLVEAIEAADPGEESLIDALGGEVPLDNDNDATGDEADNSGAADNAQAARRRRTRSRTRTDSLRFGADDDDENMAAAVNLDADGNTVGVLTAEEIVALLQDQRQEEAEELGMDLVVQSDSEDAASSSANDNGAAAAEVDVAEALTAMLIDESSDSATTSGTASPPPQAAVPALEGDPTFMYYVNDGVYGAFNCIVFDHQMPKGMPLRAAAPGAQLYECSVWGPTCDSLDKIEPASTLPELEVGDWIFYPNMGAYTMAAASNFNGFSFAEKYYTFSVASDTAAKALPASLPIHPSRLPKMADFANMADTAYTVVPAAAAVESA